MMFRFHGFRPLTARGRGCEARCALLLTSALAGLVAAPAWGQVAEPQSQDRAKDSVASDQEQTADEIVVTGIRRSLQESVGFKRQAAQVVDAISAEAIGKLPDQNIAESLQRVTGVQISRLNGQGNGVAIRGLTQVRYEINGATLTGNGTDRAVAFESIPSELFSRIEVYKSPTADMVEGGLGGTINLVTRRPLDVSRMTIAGSVQAGRSDFRKQWYPKASALVSNKWDTGVGEFGALLNVSYDQVRLRQDTFQVFPWDRVALGDLNRDGSVIGATSGPLTADEVWRPRMLRFTKETQDRKRLGAVATLQWRPSPALEFTLIGSYNKFKYTNNNRLLRIDVNRPFADTLAYNRASDGTLLGATIQNVTGITNNFVTPTDQTNFTTQFQAKWKATDRFTVSLVGDTARGKTEVPLNLFPSLGFAQPLTLTYNFAAPNPLPSVTTNFNFGDLHNFNLFVLNAQGIHTRNNEDAIKADLGYDLDAGILKKLSFGARYAKQVLSSQFDSNILTANRGLPVLGQTVIPAVAFTGTLPGGNDYMKDVPGDLPRGWAGYDADYLNGAGNAVLRNAYGVTVPLTPNRENYYTITEATWAGYLKLDLEGHLGNMPWSANAGVRVIKTDTHSSAYLPDASGNLTWTDAPNSYTDTLPSANLRLDVRPDLIFRLAAAKVVARAAPAQLSGATVFNFAALTATAGNPNLKPFRATQFDASLEWYFDKNSLLSVALFYKNVSAFIQNGTVDITVLNPAFPGQNTIRLSRPANGNSGKIKGFELGFQHTFEELPGLFGGFGVQGNYTFIASTTPNVDPFDGRTLPLDGLSKHSYNAAIFYEKSGFSARLAYNWRSNFLNGSSAGSPNFQDAIGQLDASISYELTKWITLSAEATNLNGSAQRMYQSSEERLIQYTKYGRTLLVGARFKF